MESFFKQVWQNFSDFYQSLETSRKISLVAIAAAVTLAMIGLVIYAAKTQYKPLYTELNKEDSAKVAQMLEQGKITYQMKDGGSSIYVPEDMVETWRLEIAKRGVNFSSTVGYEVFDKQAFGTTSFVQRINKQRALEGELIKTITHIKGVNRARVHLSIPESSPFVAEKKPPRASVVLDLDRGFVMNADEVRGITSLVASSVDGMRPKHVVVIDANGQKLSENIGDDVTLETANRLALESKINRKYEKRIEDILKRVVGEGKVIAKVTADVDFAQSVETETTYDAEGSAVVSEVRNNQQIQGRRPSPQGIPGARSNLPGEEPQPGIPETRNDVNKDMVTRNMKVPTKVVKSKRPGAQIRTLSAAVMVDGKRVPILDKDGNVVLDDNGIAKTKYEAWSDAELENFQAIVASTIGLNTKRGDQIVIKNMEFAKEDLSEAEAILKQREMRQILRNLSKYSVIGIVIALFFFIVIRPFIKWITENTMESIDDFLPRTIEELEKLQENQKLPGLEDSLPVIEDKLNPEKIEGNLLKDKIIGMVEANPGKAAQLVHEMIHTVDTSNKDAS